MHATTTLPPPPDPAPEAISTSAAVLTPRGHAALAIVRLEWQLRELEPGDLAFCLELLAEVVAHQVAFRGR